MSESIPTDRIVADVPCPFCACLCDDLQLTVSGRRIVAATRACEVARGHFLAAGNDGEGPACRIAGKPASLEQAIRRAAEILRGSHYPLVWGLGRATCEAQASAGEIAERLGGVLDVFAAGDLDALQTIGEVTCTLGEIRGRADFVLVWNTDPVLSQPRFFERYGPQSLGQPGGCPLVVVDSRSTPTATIAERHLQILAGSEFESATVLWALAKGLEPEPGRTEEQTGVPLAAWQSLFAVMQQARYGTILHGDAGAGPSFLSPLHGLVRTLNDRARWVGLRLGGATNGAGAEQVLTWRTGYPRCIDFSHGYPRSNPTDFSAERLLERGEVDAALIVCDDPQLSLSIAAQARLQEIPTVAIDWQETSTWSEADVSIRVATPGVESAGTMFRLDGVPLALRPAIVSKNPADFEVMRMLATALQTE